MNAIPARPQSGIPTVPMRDPVLPGVADNPIAEKVAATRAVFDATETDENSKRTLYGRLTVWSEPAP